MSRYRSSFANRRTVGMFIITLAAFTIAVSLLFQYVPTPVKRQLISNSLVQYFIHSYHSLRKLPDIAFFPYWFFESQLPTYHLIIDEADLKALETALPKDPIRGQLGEVNRIAVKATFLAGTYQDRVDIRYRGTNANHWNTLKHSWRINFKSANMFEGMEGLNLVIPSDRGQLAELINMHRAQKLGLITPELKLVRLKINMRDYGVYIAFENWSPSWVEKNALPTSGNLMAIDDTASDFNEVSAFMKEGAHLWKSYSQEKLANGSIYPEITTLVELLEKSDDETFRRLLPKIVDMPKLYAWGALNILARSSHQTDLNNSVLYFNAATGKFEPIPWDVGFNLTASDAPYKESQTLARRAFSIPEFRDKRDAIVKDYTNNPHNLENDLAFYDGLAKQARGDFFRDNMKLNNNISFISDIRKLRAAIEHSFKNTASALADTGSSIVAASDKGSLVFGTGFEHFTESAESQEAFLARHPEFYKIDAETIGIRGTHLLSKTIIIPSGLNFVVEPGTTLTLQEKVTLLSYSPIIAVGSPSQQIRIRAAEENKPFGGVLVLDSKGTSRFEWVEMSGGSGAHINGVVSTAMLGFHGDNKAEVRNSIFRDTYDDDAVNAKYGTIIIAHNVFQNTFSDAIDLDYNDGVVEENSFQTPIGRATDPNLLGDAMDISFSKAVIRNNIIEGCSDKGISIGEWARPTVENNIIQNCPIGIAIKDQADAVIRGGKLSHNGIAISLYRKKQIFGGGHATISGVIMEANKKDIEKDSFSSYESR